MNIINKRNLICSVFIVLLIFIFLGCAAKVRVIEPDKEMQYDEKYGYTDLQNLANSIVDSILKKSPVGRRNDKPVLIVYGITNKTMEHIDTKGITDTIRTKLIQSNKFRFVNKTQRDNIIKEMEYQSKGYVDQSTMIKKGRQIGAELMLTGTLMSIEKDQMKQMRLKKKKLQYYKLTMELTNLQTSLIEWSEEKEIVKEVSKPLIGW